MSNTNNYNYYTINNHKVPTGKFNAYYNYDLDHKTNTVNNIYTLDAEHNYTPLTEPTSLSEYFYDISTGALYKRIALNATYDYVTLQDSTEYDEEQDSTEYDEEQEAIERRYDEECKYDIWFEPGE